ncbi:MAG: protein kinase [Candidatus Riflebacteria bacterium]|nr:protein kinase [Candidatus Riflebacteria bacterium]
MKMNLNFSPKVRVKNSILFLNETPFVSHEIIKLIGSGVNGVVFLAKNKFLNREEAVKVWVKLKPIDKRDKLKQGILEAQKMAAANKIYAVQIYFLTVIEDMPVATMEYIPGVNLKHFFLNECKGIPTPLSKKELIFEIARLYLNAIDATSTDNSLHGDPHLSNVLIFVDERGDARIKLCDFGTSVFARKNFSAERHWRIVETCILEMTKTFKYFNFAKGKLAQFKKMLSGPMPQNIVGPLQDYLQCIEMEFFE